MCPIRRIRKGYCRNGDYVEVRLTKTASYSMVVCQAMEVLHVEEDEEEKVERELSVFRIDRTVVPKCSIRGFPWTITRYLKSLGKTPGQLKLGVGFTIE